MDKTTNLEFLTKNYDGTYNYTKRNQIIDLANIFIKKIIKENENISLNFTKLYCDCSYIFLDKLRNKNNNRISRYSSKSRDSVTFTKELYIKSHSTLFSAIFYKASLFSTDICAMSLNNLFLNESMVRHTNISSTSIKKLYFNNARFYDNTRRHANIKISKEKVKKKSNPLFIGLNTHYINTACNFNEINLSSTYIIKKMYKEAGTVY